MAQTIKLEDYKKAHSNGELTLDSMAFLKSLNGKKIISKAKNSFLYQKIKKANKK